MAAMDDGADREVDFCDAPNSMKNHRACLRCGLVKCFDQFYQDGCENCPFLELADRQDRVGSCTTSDFGGIVAMGTMIADRGKPGHYRTLFHDDGRFIAAKPQRANPVRFTLYSSLSTDGGLSWAEPETIQSSTAIHLCEPGAVRSPDGKQVAVLLQVPWFWHGFTAQGSAATVSTHGPPGAPSACWQCSAPMVATNPRWVM